MELTLRLEWDAEEGEIIFLALDPTDGCCLECPGGVPAPFVPVGSRLLDRDEELFQITANGWLSTPEPGAPTVRGSWAVALRNVEPSPDGRSLTMRKKGMSLAWITLSDTCAQGERIDLSGPTIEILFRQAMAIDFSQGFVIPDDPWQLKGLLSHLALIQRFDFIVTTGGTGLSPRAITPAATLAGIEKRLPGFEQAMTAASLQKTPTGAVSRAVAGTLGQSIIVNLPGSRKAVEENLAAVLPAMEHALKKLQGETAACGT